MKRALRLQLITFVLVLVSIAAVGYLGWQGREAHHALCIFKNDLQQRHDNAVEYLVLHPHGVAGVSAGDIQRSIDSQQATLDSLSSLSCTPPPVVPSAAG